MATLKNQVRDAIKSIKGLNGIYDLERDFEEAVFAKKSNCWALNILGENDDTARIVAENNRYYKKIMRRVCAAVSNRLGRSYEEVKPILIELAIEKLETEL